MTTFFKPLVASLQSQKTLSQVSDIIGLLQQVAFIFHNLHFFLFVLRYIKETLIRIDIQRNYCNTARFLIIYFIFCFFPIIVSFSKLARNAIVYFNVSGSVLKKRISLGEDKKNRIKKTWGYQDVPLFNCNMFHIMGHY